MRLSKTTSVKYVICSPIAGIRFAFDFFFQLFRAVKVLITTVYLLCWLRGTVVERWTLTGKLSLSCTRPAADG